MRLYHTFFLARTMELIDIDEILDKELGKRGTPQRKAAIRQARIELKTDLCYYARRGERVTLKDIFSLR